MGEPPLVRWQALLTVVIPLVVLAASDLWQDSGYEYDEACRSRWLSWGLLLPVALLDVLMACFFECEVRAFDRYCAAAHWSLGDRQCGRTVCGRRTSRRWRGALQHSVD